MKKIKIIPLVGIEIDDIKIALYSSPISGNRN